MQRHLISSVFTLSLLMTGTASAQDAAQAGSWTPPPPSQPATTTPQAESGSSSWYNQQEQERPPVLGGRQAVEAPPSHNDEEPLGDSDSDHAGVIGALGAGFMGTTQLPIGTIEGSSIGVDSLTAPSIGVRYWLSESLGLDVAVGFAMNSSTVETNMATARSTVVSETSQFGFSLHAGAPLVLHHRDHYKLLFIPSIDFGYASGSQPGIAFNASVDDLVSGLLLRVSAALAAEIHFGFMDIPQLSVQAGVGFNMSYVSVSNDICQDPQCSNTTLTNNVSGLSLGTDVNGQPWQILTGALSAIYYFQ